MDRSRRQQQPLPFGEAEGSYHERRNLLELALMRCDADLTLARLAITIFDATHGGRDGEVYKRTYKELGERSRWGLWCSAKTAQRAVEKARALGLITVHPTFDAVGHQGSNAYAIDWDGIYTALDLSRRPGSVKRPKHAVPDGQFDQGGGQSDHHPGQNDQPYKEVSLSVVSSPPPTPASASPEWTAAAAELSKAGALNADVLVELCRTTGRTPDDARQIAAVLADPRNAGRFAKPGGAAKYFLETGAWPADRVADPIREAEQRRLDDDRRRRSDDETAKRAAALADEWARTDRLNDELGDRLDGMSGEERDALAGAVFGEGTPMHQAYRNGGVAGPRSVVRVELLEALASRPPTGRLSFDGRCLVRT